MSSIVVFTPVIVASWPAISAAVTAVSGSLGYALARTVRGTVRVKNTVRAELDLPACEALTIEASHECPLVIEGHGVRAEFARVSPGVVRVCLEGAGHSRSELHELGEELLAAVTQQCVYHHIVAELKARRMTIVDEEVTADRAVRIRIRNPV